jgi:acetyltransferase
VRLKHLAQPARLRDGRPAWIREVRPDDDVAVGRFVQGLSPASRYFRFMMGMRELSADALRHFTQPEAGREAVLVATPGTSLGKVVGVAQFVIDDGGEDAEFALVIDDAWQRQGLGTRMLAELAGHAARHGVTRIHADVLADNHAMRRLAEKTGCELRANPGAPWVLQLSARLQAPLPQRLPAVPGLPLFARATP